MILGVSVALALAAVPSSGASREAFKAAMIYRLATFVAWPESALGDGSFVIGVLGASDVAGQLKELSGAQTIGGRPIEVRRIDGAAQLGGCVLVFVGQDRGGELEEVLSRASGRSLLTVSDVEGFASRGGMIELVRDGRKLKFEVHRGAATDAGLRVSSRLLELAAAVYPPVGDE